MTEDELRKVEADRRKATWALASLHPDDPDALVHLSILDTPNCTLPLDNPLQLNELREFVPVKYHHSGINVVLELDIP